MLRKFLVNFNKLIKGFFLPLLFLFVLLETGLYLESIFFENNSSIKHKKQGVLFVGDSILVPIGYNIIQNKNKRQIPFSIEGFFFLDSNQYSKKIIKLLNDYRPQVLVSLFGSFDLFGKHDRQKLLSKNEIKRFELRSLKLIYIYLNKVFYSKNINYGNYNDKYVILNLLITGRLQDSLEYFKANLNLSRFEEMNTLIKYLTYYIISKEEYLTENLAEVFLSLKVYLESRLADKAREINALDSKLYTEKGDLLFSIYNELKKTRSYLHHNILLLNFTINKISYNQYLRNFKMKSGVEGFELSRLLSFHYRNNWNSPSTRRLHNKLRAFYIELQRTENWVRDILHETSGLHVNPKSIINSFKKNKISLFDEIQAVGLFMYLKKNKNVLNYNQFDLARKIILWSTNGQSIDWKLSILNHFQIGDTKGCNLCKTLQNKAEHENKYKIHTVNIEINAQRKYLAALNEIKKNLGDTRWLIMQYPGYNFDFVQEEFENDKNINLFNTSPIIFPLLKDLNYEKVFSDRIGHFTGHFTKMSIKKINEKLYPKILNEIEIGLKNKKLRREKNGY